MRSQNARLIVLSGYTALLGVIVAWHAIFYPVPGYTLALTALFLIPLLFALPGVIKGKPYTHAWLSMLILLYFIHGIGEVFAAAPEERVMAWLEILFSVQVYTGAVLYARLRSRELKQAQQQ